MKHPITKHLAKSINTIIQFKDRKRENITSFFSQSKFYTVIYYEQRQKYKKQHI